MLQPLVVIRREIENENGISVEYELIAGERRLRASKLAGLSQVPVVIRKESDEKTKLELAIIENLQREDLNAIDRAMAFGKLAESFKLKHHEIAARVGKSREYVSNTIRLLMLPEEIQSGLVRGEVSEGHCRTLLALDGRLEEQMALYRDIVEKKMSVRLVEKITRNMVNGILAAEESVNAELKSIEKKLADSLGTKSSDRNDGRTGNYLHKLFLQRRVERFYKQNDGGKNVPIEASRNEVEKSIDGIIENKNAENAPASPSLQRGEPVASEPSAEKSDFSGAATVDPVEELLKNFSL